MTRVLLIPDTLLGDVLDTLEEDGWRWRRRCGVFVLRTQPPYEDEEFGVA